MHAIYDFLRLAWTCELTCESISPPFASPYASSGFANLHQLASTCESAWPRLYSWRINSLHHAVVFWLDSAQATTCKFARHLVNSLLQSSRKMWPTDLTDQIFELRFRRPTFGSSAGSNCTIQSTSGMSRPRAATSVHRRIPDLALQNSKKVVVRLCCFCFPCWYIWQYIILWTLGPIQ